MTEEFQAIWSKTLEKRAAAIDLFHLGYWSDSLSRSYYSAFHAVTLLFLTDSKTFSSHKQLKGNFNKEYIHPGILNKALGVGFEFLFECRQSGDYDVQALFDKTDALKGLETLDTLLRGIRAHIASHIQIHLDDIPERIDS